MKEDPKGINEVGSMEQWMAEGREERRRALCRHRLPAGRTLKDMLAALTKSELGDICYNLHVDGASALKKAELTDRLAPAIEAFAERWLPTIVEDQYACFAHLVKKGGTSAELSGDDARLDYLRGIGMVSCGVEDDKLVWFMPDEIRAAFQKIDSGTYRSMVDLNTEVARLAAGILFYYGVLDYEQLHDRALSYLEAAQREMVSLRDFVGILFNVSCWSGAIVALSYGAKFCTLIDEERLEHEQRKRSGLGFAPLSYREVYEAGEAGYIAATDAYKALAQFFMQAHGKDVLTAADITGEIYILLQNGGSLREAADYLEELGLMADEKKAKAAAALLIDYYNTTRLWPLKGHTPAELMAGEGGGKVVAFEDARRRRAGRNEPCPCGSGKKYKNCCMKKDEE